MRQLEMSSGRGPGLIQRDPIWYKSVACELDRALDVPGKEYK
jgi:hypothetical protein